jgi:hypothetical protein
MVKRYFCNLICLLLFMPISVAWSAPTCLKTHNLEVLLKPEKRSIWSKIQQVTGSPREVFSDSNVVEILNNEDQPIYGQRLEKIVDAIVNSPNERPDIVFVRELKSILKAEGWPDALIDDGYRTLKPDHLDSVYRLLGDLSFSEVRRLYMGSVKGVRVTAKSLIGQYIQETGAATKVMKIVAFDKSRTFDQDKLVVAVSAQSFPKFLELFSGKHLMSVFGHANVFHNGKVYSYSGGPSGPLRSLSPGTPLPLLILKSSEAERLSRYMELSTLPKYRSWTHPLKHPWRLKGYVKAGVWECCTHWIGNIPIGDKTVNAYHLPYQRADFTPEQRAKIAIGEGNLLQPWHDPQYEDLKNVWTYPGREQLSSVINRTDSNLANEFASPGWVIQSLMGPTSNERVPVIFIFATDHQAPIADNPAWSFERPW